MRIVIKLRTEKEAAAAVNAMWRQAVPDSRIDYLVRDDESIELAMDALRMDRAAGAVPLIETLDDWDQHFPALARGCGEIAIEMDGVTGTFDSAELQTFKATVQWVIEHRQYFVETAGFEALEGLDVFHDLVGRRAESATEVVTFENLPRRQGHRIYELCVTHSAPELWQAFLAFQRDPSKHAWDALKQLPVPWSENAATVLKLALRVDEVRTNEPALHGQFSTGDMPSTFDVERALRYPERSSDIARQRSRRAHPRI